MAYLKDNMRQGNQNNNYPYSGITSIVKFYVFYYWLRISTCMFIESDC